ncbi:hypothetical protein [Chitinophaga qingshengii]|uniref:Uncharacterized protein n=1 Tax=Chitinophaga qingshengii TaxID=1569794 RepID=A0ABR7TFD0_9BACT|nr:hypothetical protein [Chitinophaga qingshengii]MBC9929041.1 hypothetical protein [Chitinophaga qingshengii]
MSDKMMVSGYTANDQGYLQDTTIPIDSHMPFTGDPKTYGMPVTVSAFYGMMYHFYKYLDTHPEVKAFFQKVYSVEFSKASLFRLLSQPGCEYVRFNFVIPEADDKISLMGQGLDANHKSIGFDVLLEKAQSGKLYDGPGDPNAEERGNGGEKQQLDLDELFAALKASGHPFGAVTPVDLENC